MDDQVLKNKQPSSLLLDEDLLDHIYDPPLWSAGPYLKMVDDDVTSCYSPVSDPLLRVRLASDESESDNATDRQCRITISSENNEQVTSTRPNRLSRKSVYVISTCLTISALLLTFLVCS